MSARHGLLAGGNWIVDHVKQIDTWPAQDALANILAQTDGNGGSAYNVLKNLARLGAELHGWGLALGFGVRAEPAPCLRFDSSVSHA